MEHALEYGNNASRDKPNIFDIHAQETTKALLHPLLQQTIRYLAEKYPGSKQLRWLMRRFDESFLGFDIVVELLSVLTSSASLCEAYYGIKRISGDHSKMNNTQKVVSLLEITVIPYLWRQARLLLERKRNGPSSHGPRKLVALIPFAYASHELLNLMMKLLYVFWDISSPSFLMFLSGIKYGRPQGTAHWNTLTPLATLMFALRFTQWWQENSMDPILSQAVIPPPIDFPLQKAIQDNLEGCPICLKDFQRPIVLPSGRVFCEKCLNENTVFKVEGRCPVTLIRVDRDAVRNLFVQPR